MNKSDLISAIADDASISKAEAGRVLDSMTNVITTSLAGGDSIVITGFGSFLVRDRSARTGRNPRTGEAIQIKASKVPSFKAGKLLKEKVNK